MAMNNGRRTSGSFRALNPPLAACHGCSKPHPISLNAPACREVWTEWRRIWTDMNYLSQGWTQVPHWRSEVCGVELAGNRVKSKCNTIQHVQNIIVVHVFNHLSLKPSLIYLQPCVSKPSLGQELLWEMEWEQALANIDVFIIWIIVFQRFHQSHKEWPNYPLSCQNTAVLQKELPIEGPLAMKVRHLLQWTWTNMCTGSWFYIEFINSFPKLLGRLTKLQTKKHVTL